MDITVHVTSGSVPGLFDVDLNCEGKPEALVYSGVSAEKIGHKVANLIIALDGAKEKQNHE